MSRLAIHAIEALISRVVVHHLLVTLIPPFLQIPARPGRPRVLHSILTTTDADQDVYTPFENAAWKDGCFVLNLDVPLGRRPSTLSRRLCSAVTRCLAGWRHSLSKKKYTNFLPLRMPYRTILALIHGITHSFRRASLMAETAENR